MYSKYSIKSRFNEVKRAAYIVVQNNKILTKKALNNEYISISLDLDILHKRNILKESECIKLKSFAFEYYTFLTSKIL
jgi:hypothetical protein